MAAIHSVFEVDCGMKEQKIEDHSAFEDEIQKQDQKNEDRSVFEAEFRKQEQFWKSVSALNEQEYEERVEEQLDISLQTKHKLPSGLEDKFRKQQKFWKDCNNSLEEEEYKRMIEEELGSGRNWQDVDHTKYRRKEMCVPANTKKSDMLQELLQTQLDGKKAGAEDRKFTCDVCHLEFKKMDTLKTHFMVHSKGVKLWPCTMCKKSLKTENKLNLHKMKIHTVQMTFCDKCGDLFMRVGSKGKHKSCSKSQ